MEEDDKVDEAFPAGQKFPCESDQRRAGQSWR